MAKKIKFLVQIPCMVQAHSPSALYAPWEHFQRSKYEKDLQLQISGQTLHTENIWYLYWSTKQKEGK